MKKYTLILSLAVSSVILTNNVDAEQYPQNNQNQQILMQQQRAFQQSPTMGNQGMMGQMPTMGNQSIMGQGQFQQMPDPRLADPQFNLGMDYNSNQNQPTKISDAPGITNPLSIQSLVGIANSKVTPQAYEMLNQAVQAYVDGNLSDARKIFSSVTETFGEGIASDRAYLGLAKIERAYGAYDVSRRILEGVIRKNRDYESIMLARRSYEDLKREVIQNSDNSRMTMEQSYARYKQVGWLSLFTKMKLYNQYKQDKQNFEALLISTKQFDMIFAQTNITATVPSGNVAANTNKPPTVDSKTEQQISDALSLEELKKALSNNIGEQKPMTAMYQMPTENITINQTETIIINPTQTETKLIAPAPAPVVKEPILTLDEARARYTSLYQELKDALKGDDNEKKLSLQRAYQKALKTYSNLKKK
ncbi:MAG: hypothetical protein COB02_04150 [Candidatus Cloacimonadota bacterium]|nr:MAG: hypothetical protein COB02_04150 [Candidatus Cloacimonadota bacterium]